MGMASLLTGSVSLSCAILWHDRKRLLSSTDDEMEICRLRRALD